MSTEIKTPDGTLTVDHAPSEVLLESVTAHAEGAHWMSCDQALELASALIGAVMSAQQSERENREPRKCGWCGDTRGLCGDVCVSEE